MKILVYGAGVIGSIFAGKLAKNGCDITVLARGDRYREMMENGIVLKNSLNNKPETIKTGVVETLNENDHYDYIIVAVQNNQISSILPVLAKNRSRNIVFVVNNPLGYEEWINSVGYERIIIGFPSAGGERINGTVHYFIGKGFAKLFQSTTFGELNGKKTERLKKLYSIFRKSGFSPSINHKMDWWQKTHVAVVLPIAKALYRYQSDNYELAKSYKTLKNMVLATRELFSILKSNHIKITPRKLLFYYLPAGIIAKIWQMVMRTKTAEYAMAKHTIAGKGEMETLEKQFMALNTKNIKLKYYKGL
ncbi:MAG: NAD-binding protein [Bacteroidales bacterium]|jgi:2-dehydropantoate 2-reductase|nr:NAD-binding protein [Bacteroidales bacterium]